MDSLRLIEEGKSSASRLPCEYRLQWVRRFSDPG
jgi:hypothetical protein